MKKLLLSTALLAAAISFGHSALAHDGDRDDDHRGQDKMTIAVFGDWPYNQTFSPMRRCC